MRSGKRHGTLRLTPLLGACILALFPAERLSCAETRLSGRVLNENGTPVGGAKITLRHDASHIVSPLVSSPGGDFTIAVPTPGDYYLEIEREGYFLLTRRKLTLAEGVNEAQFTLNSVRELITAIDVNANPGAVDMDRTTPRITLNSNDLLNVPIAATNTLRNAFRVMPGMVQDSRGDVHLHGGTESQTLYTLEGFQINDPITGRFESRIGVEGVQSLEANGGRPSAEYGKGTAGVLAIRSRSGDDKLRYTATNFFPGIERQKGWLIGGWTPRANLSGPWKRGRAWFSDSIDLQYNNTVIPELQRSEDRASAWRINNLMHNQVNLTPSNILTFGSLVNFYFAHRTGLSVLDPRETTVDRRQRQFFTYLKDQIYFSSGALLELGYANNRTWGRESPQGQDSYVFTPFGRRGNSFIDADRRAGRDQWLANLFAPAFPFLGEHRFKTGVDFDRLNYRQDVRRGGVEFQDSNLVLRRRTQFFGSGKLDARNFEAAAYVQDSWRPRSNLLFELGLRGEWDSLLDKWNASPRIGFAWMLRERTKISGGAARIVDSTNLRVYTRALDQYSASTYFEDDGRSVRGPAFSVYQFDAERLRSPRSNTWNLTLEHQFPRFLQARVNATGRDGNRGFTYINSLDASPPANFNGAPGAVFDAIYSLRNQREDHYRAVEFTLRQPIRQRYEWMVSYTRSRARSNAVLDRQVDDPLVVEHNAGVLPWDTPNRWISWGYLPLPSQYWAVAYLAEYRTGFPYSLQDARGHMVGDVDAQRFPAFFELNLFLERRILFRKNWWAVRFGFNNITNHKNPNVVNNLLGSPEFLRVYGGQSRAFNMRIRLLGKP
ncbi:MAG: TonB-dependent receptor [Candidatus Solibacter usitatus]|nr:TonB-dependent receptor [Candidatus Solibacter usitatus]